MSKLIYQNQINDYLFEVYDDKPNFKFTEVKQIHSNVIFDVKDITSETQGDGIISMENDILAIKTADCLPIAMIGSKGFALIHAGWRGVQKRIFCNDKLLEIQPHTIFLGPHILQPYYEVGKEFKNYFPPETLIQRGDKYLFDMATACEIELKKNYKDITIFNSKIDTFMNEEFNSYRRNKTNQRNWNILRRI